MTPRRALAPVLLVLAILAGACSVPSAAPRAEAALTEANTPGAPAGSDGIHLHPWAVCVRHHETGGGGVWPYEDGYGYETGNGYHGAYQFNQGLWDASVAAAGYPEFAGWPAGWTPWWAQDAAAFTQYQISGDQHWGNRC